MGCGGSKAKKEAEERKKREEERKRKEEERKAEEEKRKQEEEERKRKQEEEQRNKKIDSENVVSSPSVNMKRGKGAGVGAGAGSGSGGFDEDSGKKKKGKKEKPAKKEPKEPKKKEPKSKPEKKSAKPEKNPKNKKKDSVEDELDKELEEVHDSVSFKYEIRDLGDKVYKGQIIAGEIAGHGIYIPKKGEGYTHHYSVDLNLQYEEKLDSNGDIFRGYVRDGKPHGLGVIIKKGKGEDDEECALYSFGKKITDFDDEYEIDQINAGYSRSQTVDFFKKNPRYKKHIEKGQTFKKPEWFAACIADVEERVKWMESKKKKEHEFKVYEENKFYSREGKELEQAYRKRLKDKRGDRAKVDRDDDDDTM